MSIRNTYFFSLLFDNITEDMKSSAISWYSKLISYLVLQRMESVTSETNSFII
jgi:hypothetical protein